MPNLGNHVDAVFIPESVNTSTTLKINGGDLNVNNGQFFVDQSTTNVGIGTTQPQHLLDIWGDGPDTAQLTLRQWNDNNGSGTVGDGPDMRFIASGGTIASPAEMDDDDVIGKVNAFAYDGTSSVQYGGFGWRYQTQGQPQSPSRGSSFSIETKTFSETTNSAKISITEEGNIGVGENHFTPFRTVMINGSYNTSTSEYGAPDVWLVNSLSSASSGTNLGSVVFSRSTGSTGASAKIEAKATGTDNETDLYFYNRTSGGGDNINNILNTTPTLKLYHDKTAEFAGAVKLGDGDILHFGASNGDLQIYHSGYTSYIIDADTGGLEVRSNGPHILFENINGTDQYAVFNDGGSVELYHNASKKFETTSTGVDVIGDDIRVLGPTSGSTYTTSTLTLRGYRQSTGGTFGTLSFNNIDKNSSDTEYVGARIDASATGNDGGELRFFVTPDSSTTLNTTPSLILHDDSSAEFAGVVSGTSLSTGASGTGVNISTNTISGPATLTLDPAAVGDNTGTVVIAGNLQVDGTTTTINSTTLTVDDKNIVLASGAADSAAANGAGITIDGANETFTYEDTNKSFKLSQRLGIKAEANITSNLRVGGNAGGEGNGTVYYNILNNSVVQPDVTGSFYYNFAQIKTGSNSGTAYTIGHVQGYTATVGSINTDTTITNLTGFNVKSSWTGGTNNYGFRGQISTGTNRWNVYMDGTAPNYFEGNVGIGTNAPAAKLHVSGGDLYVNSLDGSEVDIKLGIHATHSNFGVIKNIRASNSQNYLSFNIHQVNTLYEALQIHYDEGLYVRGNQDYSTTPYTGTVTTINLGDQAGRFANIVAESESASSVLGALVFKTRGSSFPAFMPQERLRITSAGSVGIGTNNPNAKLRVDWDRTEDFGFHLVQTTDGGEPDAMAITNNYDRDIGIAFRTGDSNGANQASRWHIWNDGAVSGANNNRFNISPGPINDVANGITILQDSNVGMGTGSPTDKLHVVGSIKIEASAPIIKLAETGVTGNPSWWIVQDAGNFSLRNNNTAPYAFNVATKGTNNDTTDFVSFGGDTLADVVKITAHGTNPTYLDLKGNNANARMRYFEGATERWNIGYDISSNAFTFYDVQSSGNRMRLYDNPNNGIVIGSTDNGGLTWPSTDGGGATAHQAALRVDGGNNVALFCYNNEQSGDPVAVFAKGNEADDNQVVIIAGDGDQLEELLDIRSSTNPPDESSLLSFARDNANSKFRVYGDGRVYTPYRIGVGTTDPSSPLDVIGNFEFRSPDANDTINTKIIGQFDGTGTRNTYLRIGANENRRASIVFSGVNTSTNASTDYWSIGRGDSDELNLSSFFIATGESGGNTAKLVIDSNGDVGIGTTDPLGKLDIRLPDLDGEDPDAYFRIRSIPEGNAGATLEVNNAAGTALGYMDLRGSNFTFKTYDPLSATTTTKMAINTAGNVVVNNNLYVGGTTNYFSSQPTGNYGSVQINGGGKGNWEGYSIDGRAVFMHDGSATMGLYDDVNNHWVLRHYSMGSSSVTSLRSGDNVSTLTCTSNNQVGIGTETAARGPLHIHQGTTGDTQIHLTNSETGAASTNGFTIFTGGSTGSHSGFVNREANARIRFLMHPSGGASVTDQMVLLADGNLGLGISDPIDKLHVAGGDAYFDRRVGIGTTDHTSYALSIRNIDSPTTTGGIFVDCNDWSTNNGEIGIYVDIDSSDRTNLTANRTSYGIRANSNVRAATNASDTTGTRQSIYGIYGSAHVDDTDANDGKIYQLYGGYFRARVDGVDVGNMRGMYALAQAGDNATGTARTIDNLYGTYSYALNDGNETTFTNAYGVYSHVNQDDTGGVMTNAYGVYSRMDRDGGTAGTGYAFRGNFEGTWTTKYGVYMNGETINYFSGSVGIGTNDPSSKLMIGQSTTADVNAQIIFGKRVTTSQTNLPRIGHCDILGTSTNNDLGICATSTGGAIGFFTGNGEAGYGTSTNVLRMIIEAGGNVGIGTNNPTQKLHVHGSSLFGGTISSERATTIDTNGQGFFRYDDNNLTVPLTIENRATNAVAGHGAAIRFRFGDSSSNAAHDAGRISFLQESNWTSTTTTHDAQFVISLAQNDSLEDRFIIAQNGTITMGSQEIASNGIEVGRGSGSVAMTINDGKGNANLTFNHRNGVPDNTATSQSAGRIECGVDSTNARMYFELGDSTSNGTNVNLTNVMDLDIGVVNVAGNLTATGTVTGGSSDGRLKENLVRISTPLDKIDQLHGYTFDWKAECADVGFTPVIQTNDIGLIAQDVQAVVPQAVAPAPFDHELSDDGTEDVSITGETYLTVQYERLVPLLVEAIKELRQEVESLKSQISGS